MYANSKYRIMTYATSIPQDSLIAKALERVDYQDAFAIRIKQQPSIPPAKLPLLFFSSITT